MKLIIAIIVIILILFSWTEGVRIEQSNVRIGGFMIQQDSAHKEVSQKMIQGNIDQINLVNTLGLGIIIGSILIVFLIMLRLIIRKKKKTFIFFLIPAMPFFGLGFLLMVSYTHVVYYIANAYIQQACGRDTCYCSEIGKCQTLGQLVYFPSGELAFGGFLISLGVLIIAIYRDRHHLRNIFSKV